MRVRMLTSLADRNLALHRDEEIDVAPARASAWIDAGVAELVTDEPPETPERRGRRQETRVKR